MMNEKEYIQAVAEVGCIICGSPAEIHHIREGMGASQRNDNWNILPLCPIHHRLGGAGIAYHAGADSFALNYGSERDLESILHGIVFGNEFEEAG